MHSFITAASKDFINISLFSGKAKTLFTISMKISSIDLSMIVRLCAELTSTQL